MFLVSQPWEVVEEEHAGVVVNNSVIVCDSISGQLLDEEVVEPNGIVSVIANAK